MPALTRTVQFNLVSIGRSGEQKNAIPA